MSKQLYSWLLLQSLLDLQARLGDGLPAPSPMAMPEVTAMVGVLLNSKRAAAYSTANLRLFLTLIYAWSCAKYRADLLEKHQNLANSVQNHFASICSKHYSQTLSIQGFHAKSILLMEPANLFQMNSPRTLSSISVAKLKKMSRGV